MKIMLVDSDAESRFEVEERLREFGLRVLTFADAGIAFLYLLSHLDEVEAVVLNSDGGSGLLRRLEVLGHVSAVTYSGTNLSGGGEIAMGLMPSLEPKAEDVGGVE